MRCAMAQPVVEILMRHPERQTPDRLDIAPHGNEAVRGAHECLAQPLDHRLHAPVLPEIAMPPPRAEIGNAEPFDPEALDGWLGSFDKLAAHLG